LKIRVLIITLSLLSVCLSALASAADNKVELEVLVSNYEELAVDAKNCTDSRNQKSFGNNVSRYLSIDQELTLRGVTAVGHVADTLGFLFEKQTQKLQKRT
jgi:hypothetical protein